MSENFYIGWTTVGSEAEAERIANDLIEQKLAACVQIEPIHSVYSYQGETRKDAEWRLCVKFIKSNHTALSDYIQAKHPYDIPEWVTVQASHVNPSYLNWANLRE